MYYDYDNDRIAVSVCCICTPSLAKALWDMHGIKVLLLDIDRRFEQNVPRFTYYDLLKPYNIQKQWKDQGLEKPKIDLIIFDPPFFGVTME